MLKPLPKPPKKRWYKRAGIWLLIVIIGGSGLAVLGQQLMDRLTPVDTVTQQTVTAEKRTLTKVVNNTGKISDIGYRTNYIDVLASESEVFDVAVDQTVDITVLAYDNGATTYHGVVESVANKKTIVSATETGYLVRIRPTDLPETVSRLIDLTVNVNILIDQRDDVLAIERAAVQYRADDTAYVLLPGQVEQTIVTGFEGDDYVEIVSGLEAGDEVLLNIPKAETASPF